MPAVQVAQEEMVPRHSAVGLLVLLLTSTWKTNLAFLWWIIKLLLHAGAVGSPVEGLLVVAVCPLLIGGLLNEVAVVVSITEEAHSVGVGKDGETGKRFTACPIHT
jgi:hypothetical protein